MQEMDKMQVWSLCQENPLEEGVATHSSILAWKTPCTEEPGGLPSVGLQSWTQLKWLSMHARGAYVTIFKNIFLCWPFFKRLYWICCNIFSVFMFWFLGHETHGILVSQLGIEPVPPALKGEVLTTELPWTNMDTSLLLTEVHTSFRFH